jgi:GNAT superfamily N-acetyltransferase
MNLTKEFDQAKLDSARGGIVREIIGVRLCYSERITNRAHMSEEWRRGEYVISTDPARLNLTVIHAYLSTSSYWAAGRPREVMRRAIENSLPFGVFWGAEQIGFARVVTDYATFAWLADVFVLPAHQGRGIGKWLMGVIVDHPRLQGLRRWILATRDAHGLYAGFGFTGLHAPELFMERFADRPDYEGHEGD